MNNELVEELKMFIKRARWQVTKLSEGEYPTQYVDVNIYANIQGLNRFVLFHKELSNEDIENIIKHNAKIFKILNQLIIEVPDFIDELRLHGVMAVSKVYHNQQEVTI